MNKHLVIFSPVVQWPVHFETDLELAQLHLDQGWRVTFLCCRGALPTCAQNVRHYRSVCRRCVSRFGKGMRWLGQGRVSVEEFQSLSAGEEQTVAAIDAASFATLGEIRRFAIEGAPIGLAAVGAVISFLREPNPDVREHRELFTAHLRCAALSYFSILNQLSRLRPDRFVIFNGRFAELRAALNAGHAAGVPTFVHERAGVLERYSLLANTSPHDVQAMKRIIEDSYARSPLGEDEKQRLATEWYEERRNNQAQSWYSFTAEQKKGLLPDFAAERCNVVIFNSSEDEMVAYDDWQNSLYTDQNHGIERILGDLGGDRRFKFFLRVHPNLRQVDNSQTRGILSLGERFPELSVIPADSPVSTYGILDSPVLVLVFGSTVGVEAAYAGRPTFLMGRAYYENMGCCVRPQSHEELIGLLSRYASGERDMLPDPGVAQKAVVRYGFFFKSWGESYRYVKPVHVGRSLMVKEGKETRLTPSIASWAWDRILDRFRPGAS